jgi:hypothetical protein
MGVATSYSLQGRSLSINHSIYMATIINNPSGNAADDSSVGIIVGVLVVIVLAVLFYFFAYPSIRSNNSLAPASNNAAQPAGGSASVNVQLPGTNDNTTQKNP